MRTTAYNTHRTTYQEETPEHEVFASYVYYLSIGEKDGTLQYQTTPSVGEVVLWRPRGEKKGAQEKKDKGKKTLEPLPEF